MHVHLRICSVPGRHVSVPSDREWKSSADCVVMAPALHAVCCSRKDIYVFPFSFLRERGALADDLMSDS